MNIRPKNKHQEQSIKDSIKIQDLTDRTLIRIVEEILSEAAGTGTPTGRKLILVNIQCELIRRGYTLNFVKNEVVS